jgi:hypothetical protein
VVAISPAARAELLHVLMLPDFERADRIGEFWGNPQSRTFAELLIDCEEDRTLRYPSQPTSHALRHDERRSTHRAASKADTQTVGRGA